MNNISPVAVGSGPFTLPHGRLLYCADPTRAESGLFLFAAADQAVA